MTAVHGCLVLLGEDDLLVEFGELLAGFDSPCVVSVSPPAEVEEDASAVAVGEESICDCATWISVSWISSVIAVAFFSICCRISGTDLPEM